MRTAIGVVVVTLTLSLACGLVRAQTRGDASPLESVRMLDALTGWAVTDQPDANVLLRTTDGGMHWRDVTPRSASGRRIAVGGVAVLTSLIAWAFPYEEHQVFHTADGGGTWEKQLIPALGPIHFINTRDGWLMSGMGAAGSMEADIYRSTDGGRSWAKVASTRAGNESSGLPFAGDKGNITFLNAATGWVTGTIIVPGWLYLYVTHDGGRTWRQQALSPPPGLTSRWFDVTTPPKFFTANDGVLLVFYASEDPTTYGPRGTVAVLYGTHDGGTTWTSTTSLSVSQVWDLPSSFTDMDHGWIADGDALYLTNDGGHQWLKIQPAPTFADVRQLDFVSPQLGWALRHTPPFLLKTLDGGHTWAPLTYTISQQ